jgi:hypothetical protein
MRGKHLWIIGIIVFAAAAFFCSSKEQIALNKKLSMNAYRQCAQQVVGCLEGGPQDPDCPKDTTGKFSAVSLCPKDSSSLVPVVYEIKSKKGIYRATMILVVPDTTKTKAMLTMTIKKIK